MTAHWGVPDPAETTEPRPKSGSSFADVLRMLTNRINIFVSLPIRCSINSPCKSNWMRLARLG